MLARRGLLLTILGMYGLIFLRGGERWLVMTAFSAILSGAPISAWAGLKHGGERDSAGARPAAVVHGADEEERRARSEHLPARRRLSVAERRLRRSAVVNRCLRRALRWRLPPHWSRQDWLSEAELLAASAAFEAERDFDPAVGVPREAFVYRRVLSSLISRYRGEWRYARNVRGAEPGVRRRRDWAREELPRLCAAIRRLPEQDGWLLRRLYGDGAPERAVADELGISQQAVSKRKRAALERLRAVLDEDRIIFPQSGAARL